jgi:competence protein ComEC
VLHKEIPFLRICVSLCAGIIAGLYLKPGHAVIVASGIIIIILFLFSLKVDRYAANLFFGAAMGLALFFSGLMLYKHEKESLSVLQPVSSVFLCELSEYPEEKPGSILLNVKLMARADGSGTHVLKGSMLLYHEKAPEAMQFVPGDRITVRCTPEELVNRGNPEEFNYRFYMENLGIKYYAFVQNGDILSHSEPQNRKLVHSALITRRRIIEMYRQRGISDERLPLVSALTLGEKSNLDPDQKESFMKAGIMHIMAVSGLHAVILSLFVINMLFFLKRKFNFLRILIAVIFLWSFAFVTGLTPSVMRATLMFTFIQAGNLMHRRANGINSVLASAFVLMIIKPSVIFNAGFLLSYSAVIFIIAFYRGVYLKLHAVNKLTDWIWQSVVVTFVAQAGTLPLTIMFFNRFPVYFLITNLVIVPLSSVAIILGCLIPLFFPVSFISGILGLALDKITALIIFLTETAASLPYSGIQNIGMTVSQGILLFSTLTAMMFFFLGKKRRPSIPLFILLALYITAGAVKDIRLKTTSELIVYNTRNHPVTGIRNGKTLHLFSDTAFLPPEVLRHSSTLGLKKTIHVSGEIQCIRTGEKVVQIGLNRGYNLPQQPDFLILTGQVSGSDYNNYDGIMILTGAIRKIPPSMQTGGENRSGIHLVRKSGAYVTKL